MVKWDLFRVMLHTNNHAVFTTFSAVFQCAVGPGGKQNLKK